jgi:DNA-binding CsgD family transcriptional regulator/PAS domain-containing protein
MNQDELNATVDLIYDAALEPGLWPEALTRVAVMLNGVGALIVHDDFVRTDRSFLLPGRLDPQLYRNYVDDYMPANPWAIAATRMTPGTIVSIADMVPTDRLTRTSFYQDVLRPQDILHCLVETAVQTPTSALSVAVVRSPGMGEGDADDKARFAQVSHHLARAARLTVRTAEASRERTSLEHTLDALEHGVLLVDRDARLIWANQAAERFLAANDGLRLAGGVVHGASGSVTRALAALVADAATKRRGAAAIRVERPSTLHPYIVSAAPTGSAERWPVVSGPATGRAAAILLVTDPATDLSEAQAAAFGSLYGLTETEARVAALVGAGHSTPKAAALLAVSAATVRTHLSHCFDKTGVRSQVELARLIALMPGNRLLSERPTTQWNGPNGVSRKS